MKSLISLNNDEALTKLSNCLLLKEMHPDQIAALLKRGTISAYTKGAVILEEKNFNHMLFIILSGAVRVHLPKKTMGTERVLNVDLAVLGPGEVIGEYSTLDNKVTSACATALEACQLLEVNKKNLEALTMEDISFGLTFYKNFLKLAVGRFRKMMREDADNCISMNN